MPSLPSLGHAIDYAVRVVPLVLALACGGKESTGPSTGPAAVALESGNTQAGPAGLPLGQPLVVRVTSSAGAGVQGVVVSWATTAGGGMLSAVTATTTANGQASVAWTLGTTAGTNNNRATATVSGLAGSPVTFIATATPNATISGTVTLANAFLAPPRTAKGGTVADAVPAPLRLGPKSSLADWIGKFRGGTSRGSPDRTLTGREYVPGELIVTFRAGALGAPRIGSLALAAPATVRAVATAIRSRLSAREAAGQVRTTGVSPAVLAARVRVVDIARLDDVAAALRQDPTVAAVERNQLRYAYDVRRTPPGLATSANDYFYPYQAWHYTMIGLPEAWDITRGSAAVIVAVVDDGIRFDHPDIAGNLTADGFDFVSDVSVPVCAGGVVSWTGDGDGYDANPTIPVSYDFDGEAGCVVGTQPDGGHGLHVAGTIGAVGNNGVGVTGVNWTVRIRPVRAVSSVGAGSDYDIAQAILYSAGLPADDGAGGTIAPATAARVINLSLGSTTPSTVEHDAIIQATAAGALVVAAAGNDGTSTPNYPAAFDEVLSVSAVGPDLLLASYSTFGSTVDIAAPGGDVADGGCSFGVTSTWWDFAAATPLYNCINGTSMAAPHVTGVAALLLAQSPGLTPAALRARLTTYATDLGPAGRDDSYGAGIVNARNSLTQGVAPPRALYVRLFHAVTGALVRTVVAATNGSYAFTALDDGGYRAFAGQDQSGDQQLGVPGRRWGAHGGSATPTTLTVAGAGTYPASFPIGLPTEQEPNGSFGTADELPVGGYLYGTIAAPLGSATPDADVSHIRVPTSGQYTFETSAWAGACGFALEEDTYLSLYDSSGGLLVSNDDIDASVGNFCSRITVTLSSGTYDLVVWGYGGLRYRVRARAGP